MKVVTYNVISLQVSLQVHTCVNLTGEARLNICGFIVDSAKEKRLFNDDVDILTEVIHRYTAELLTLPWLNCLLLGFWANYMSLADHKSIQRGRLGEVILNITYVAHSRHPYIESLPTL